MQSPARSFDAVAKTLPLGSVMFERKQADDGGYFIWLDPRALDRLPSSDDPARVTAT